MIEGMRRNVLILLLISGLLSAAEFNFVRVGGRYYLATKAADGSLVTRQVTVAFFDIDGTPVPPGPGPGPNPEPTIPDGWNGLTKLVYTAAMKVGDKSIRSAKAKALGDNFAGVASGLAAGAYADINAANADLKAKNEASTGLARETWVPVIAEEAKAMQALFTAGKFNGLDDYSQAYHAVAAGFHLAAEAP